MEMQESKLASDIISTQENIRTSDNLPEEAVADADRFYNAIIEEKDIPAIIPEILEFIEKYPETPIFTNYITLAYNIVQNKEQCDYWVKESYRRFPAYLYARCAYANYCIAQKKLTEVPAIFNNCFNLNILYKRTHFSSHEILTYYTTLVNFHIHVGSFSAASQIITMLTSNFDKHPAIEKLTIQLYEAIAEYSQYQKTLANKPLRRIKSSKKRK